MTVNKITTPPKAFGDVTSKINEIIDNLGGGGSSTLSGLTDVTITSATNGQVLSYNGSGWVNSNPTTITFRQWS